MSITLTNERQQALIEDCKREISHAEKILESSKLAIGWRKIHEKNLLKNQIVLASLTAEPIYQDLHFCFPEGEPEVAYWSEVDASSFNRTHETRRCILYPAPPVPVIKLPGNLQDAFEENNDIPSQTSRCGDRYCSHSFNNWKGQEFMNEFNGFRKGIDYVKRLNGLGE